MDYERIHNCIIAYRKEWPLPKGTYSENHHIILKSLGGSDDKSNRVKLTGREHYIIHLLLTKFNPCQQTFAAAKMMAVRCKHQSGRPAVKNNRAYQKIREEWSKLRKGYKHTDETKAKVAASWQTRSRVMTDEQKKKISKSGLGLSRSVETRKKISEAKLGKKRPASVGRKISETKQMQRNLIT
jgi:hypothetical protein